MTKLCITSLVVLKLFFLLDKNKCTAEFELKTQAFVSLVLIMRAKIVEMGLQRAGKKWKGWWVSAKRCVVVCRL